MVGDGSSVMHHEWAPCELTEWILTASWLLPWPTGFPAHETSNWWQQMGLLLGSSPDLRARARAHTHARRSCRQRRSQAPSPACTWSQQPEANITCSSAGTQQHRVALGAEQLGLTCAAGTCARAHSVHSDRGSSTCSWRHSAALGAQREPGSVPAAAVLHAVPVFRRPSLRSSTLSMVLTPLVPTSGTFVRSREGNAGTPPERRLGSGGRRLLSGHEA